MGSRVGAMLGRPPGSVGAPVCLGLGKPLYTTPGLTRWDFRGLGVGAGSPPRLDDPWRSPFLHPPGRHGSACAPAPGAGTWGLGWGGHRHEQRGPF